MHLGDILDILNERSDSTLSLNDAMSMARDIMSLHTVGMRENYGEGYEQGYKFGHEVGKSLVSIPTPGEWELKKLQNCYDMSIQSARDNVRAYINRIGADKKIQVIKEVRARHFLGLKESKDIVDAAVEQMNREQEEERRHQQELIAQAQDSANYSDEPPF